MAVRTIDGSAPVSEQLSAGPKRPADCHNGPPAAPTGRPARRAGRPMDVAKDAVILRATQEILAQVGYEQLTIEAVAARARASKNTIYRRWASKPELVTAAILALRPQSPLPDTGSLRGDVRAAVLRYGGLDEFGVEVMLSVTIARRHHEDLARRIDAGFHSWTRSVGRELFERAAARGEIGEDEVPTLALVLGALTFHRQVAVQRPSDETYAEFVADRVLLPLAAALRSSGAVPTGGARNVRRRRRRSGELA